MVKDKPLTYRSKWRRRRRGRQVRRTHDTVAVTEVRAKKNEKSLSNIKQGGEPDQHEKEGPKFEERGRFRNPKS